MFDRILFPTDGSEPATETVGHLLTVASEHGSTVHVLSVVESGTDRDLDASTRRKRRAIAEEIVESVASQATDAGVPAETAIEEGNVAESIVEYADSKGIDLVVMPTHGQEGVDRVLLGSVTERVITAVDCPVLTLNPQAVDRKQYPCRTILVPTDGSQHADRAVRIGAKLAAATGGTLHLLNVAETARFGFGGESVLDDDDRKHLAERGNDILHRAKETAESEGLKDVATTVEFGRPYREIQSYVTENEVCLVVLGIRGTTDFSRRTLGGVTSKILRTARVPLLTTSGTTSV